MIKPKFGQFPILLLIVFLCAGIFYLFSYIIPFTSNAFVVANITPVAANVSGFITDIYVKNGQSVQKNMPLFRLYQAPYQFIYDKSSASYEDGLAHLQELSNLSAKNAALLKMAQAELAQAKYDYNIKNNPAVVDAVSQQERNDLAYKVDILNNKVAALTQQLKIDANQVRQQQAKNKALNAERNLAKTNLALTIIRAQSNGVIDNLYVNNGTQVSPNQALFSLINTDTLYVQANFNEIDLRNVRIGDRVIILPRMYFGAKVYHGVVTSNVWNVNRQETLAKNQLQTVTQNEDNWILLPQRLPVQIKIIDYDAKDYPLSVGASCYVYVQTKSR